MTDTALQAASPGAAWLTFLDRRAETRDVLLELDGSLTGVIVAPTAISSSLWIAGLWAEEQPIFDDAAQIQSVLSGLGARLNALSLRGLRRSVSATTDRHSR